MPNKQYQLVFKRATNNPVLIVILLLVILIGSWMHSIQRDWPFIQAVGAGDINKVRAGLNSGIDPNTANEKGATAMMAAMASGRPNKRAMVQLLLDHGANPNSGLYGAVRDDRPDLVRLLIAHGANVNVRAGDGTSLISEAEQQGRDKNAHEIIRILRSAGEKN